MRGKRSKQYCKLMQTYSLTFGFRPPYQVLVDAEMIQDTERFKMDLVSGLERSLGEKVKPMITQCSIRHLYTLKDIPQRQKDTLIDVAKTMERRRCNHHTLDEPLSTLECLKSIIDPKNSLVNKNRYIVASQDEAVRKLCRSIKGVPLIFVRRSVMIMEPMAEGSVGIREGLEKAKFRSGLRPKGSGPLGKRKRGDESSDPAGRLQKRAGELTDFDQNAVKKKRIKGPKGPNPLAVKKSKKVTALLEDSKAEQRSGNTVSAKERVAGEERSNVTGPVIREIPQNAQDFAMKRKRKRKPKSKDSGTAMNAIDSNVEADE